MKSPNGKDSVPFENAYGTDPNTPATQGGATQVLSDQNNQAGGGAGGGSGSGSTSTSPIAGTSGTGVQASYGVNANLRKVFGIPGKILAIDYEFSVVEPSYDNWTSVPKNAAGQPIFARHYGYANVLWADGSVRAEVPTTTNLNPSFADNRAKYWEK